MSFILNLLIQKKYRFITEGKENIYTKQKILGRGTFSKVYLVYLNDNKQDQYALKKLNKIQTHKEIEIHSIMNHPNVVKMYDYSIINKPMLILEYCKKTLERATNNNKHKIKSYMYSTLKGLNYIHSNEVIHRDLSLTNIYVDAYDNIKIGDFGVSVKIYDICKCQSKESNKCNMPICGTLNYLAPELILNRITCDQIYKIDVWAFGVIFYKLITNDFPFDTFGSLYDEYSHFKNILTINYNDKCLYPEQKKIINGIFKINPNERLSVDNIISIF